MKLPGETHPLLAPTLFVAKLKPCALDYINETVDGLVRHNPQLAEAGSSPRISTDKRRKGLVPTT